jgi:hypothetical protein
LDQEIYSPAQLAAALHSHGGEGPVHLAPEAVKAAIAALRAYVDGVGAVEAHRREHSFTVEVLDSEGSPVKQLAATNSLHLARAAYDEAVKAPGRTIALSHGARAIARSDRKI